VVEEEREAAVVDLVPAVAVSRGHPAGAAVTPGLQVEAAIRGPQAAAAIPDHRVVAAIRNPREEAATRGHQEEVVIRSRLEGGVLQGLLVAMLLLVPLKSPRAASLLQEAGECRRSPRPNLRRSPPEELAPWPVGAPRSFLPRRGRVAAEVLHPGPRSCHRSPAQERVRELLPAESPRSCLRSQALGHAQAVAPELQRCLPNPARVPVLLRVLVRPNCPPNPVERHGPGSRGEWIVLRNCQRNQARAQASREVLALLNSPPSGQARMTWASSWAWQEQAPSGELPSPNFPRASVPALGSARLWVSFLRIVRASGNAQEQASFQRSVPALLEVSVPVSSLLNLCDRKTGPTGETGRTIAVTHGTTA
jgi:hypothetical protein